MSEFRFSVQIRALSNMRIYFNKLIKNIVLYVIISFSSAVQAGSYEDFFNAIQKDDVQVISQLLSRGFDPNTYSTEAEPALFFALKKEAWKSLELLIKQNPTRLNVKNNHEETPLMLVCLKGHFGLAKYLIERDADVNQPGWTPLHYAASGGNTEIVHLLLNHSAYIDAASPNGTTPLMMAARYGNFESVKLLMTEGADIHLKNQQGLSALDFAVQGQRPDAQNLLANALKESAASGLPRSSSQ
jgi:ankyrin repeat protein